MMQLLFPKYPQQTSILLELEEEKDDENNNNEENDCPDIVIIGIQELIQLNTSNVINSHSNVQKDAIETWTSDILGYY